MEIQNSHNQGEPGDGEEQNRLKKAAGRGYIGSRPEKEFEGVEKEEDGEEEDGESRPAVEGKPGVRESKVEPAGDKEMEDEGSQRRGEKHSRLDGELR